MERVLLKISYNGSAYHGWQVQPNGVTVQEVLGRKLEQMYKSKINLTGCSRTDAGVHAREFYCHYDTDLHIEPVGIVRGLNSVLPKDIAVLSAEYVNSDFHARYSAKGKNYVYIIRNSAIHDPFEDGRVWHIERALDIDLMNKFCEKVCGTHDFYGFSSSGRTVTDTIRTVTECFVSRVDDDIVFSISANGFLYNMVRIIVGTLVETAYGKFSADDLKSILASCNRQNAGMTAPPEGLYLNQVKY